ncbi:MAG: M50 family metallopeptidase [Blastocatellia bacterium]
MRITEINKKYLALAILMTFLLYGVFQVLTFFHEMAHGLTAVSLGGYFPFIAVDADGGRSIFYFPLGSQSWKEALVLLAGPVFNFLVAVLALVIIAVGVKGNRARLIWALVGGVSALMVINMTGVFPPWRRNYKETGQALAMLGFPFAFQVTVKCLWLVFNVILIISFFRLIFRQVSFDFPTVTYRQRLALVTAVLIFPCVIIMSFQSIIMLSAGFGEGVINPNRHLPHMILLVVVFLAMPFVITSTKSDKQASFAITGRQILGWGIAAVAIASLQPVVFGNDRLNPKGLFLTRQLPEVNIEACNVVVTLENDDKVRVQLLMRPFNQTHNFLWDKANSYDPAEWKYYEEFATKNLRVLLGTDDFEIVDKYADRSTKFFNGEWGAGARVIEALAPVSSLVKADEDGGDRTLKLVDFWGVRGIGYIDYTEVKVKNGLRIKKVNMDPSSTSPMRLRADNKLLQWMNTPFSKAPVTARLDLE